MNKQKICIIGAGLSGLYAAVKLQEKYDVIVLEARNRVGGRVLNIEGHDMGPSWVWSHQKNILKLIETLGLSCFEQHTKGLALYDASEGVQKFNPSSQAISYRVKGGMSQILWALEKQLHSPVKLDEVVVTLTEVEEKVRVKTKSDTYEVDRVLSTLAPRLAVKSISYEPPLPEALHKKLENIPTWMGYSAKCVITYPKAFWKEEGLSGLAISHVGLLSEIYDACTENEAALFGFLHGQAKMGNVKEAIILQLTRMYGEKATKYTNIHLVDWKKEVYTSTELDAQPLTGHPAYGFEGRHFDGKLLFIGTESAYEEGGYLEGAINSVRKICFAV